MTFSEDFQRGWAAGRTIPGRPASGRPAASAAQRKETPAGGNGGARPPLGSGVVRKPSPIRLGYYLNRKTGQTGGPLPLDSSLHTLVVGANGAGKQTRFLTELYMTTSARSLFVFDVKGTAALQTADERRRLYGADCVKTICPFPVLHLPNDGFNPLLHRDPESKDFYSECRADVDAVIDIEQGENAHWSESASDFATALVMWECILARREKRTPSWLNVRMMGTEADKWEIDPADRQRKRATAGITQTAKRMTDEGGPIIASLVAPFMERHGGDDRELKSIQTTFRRNTALFLDPYIAATVSVKNGVDFRKQRDWPPMSVYTVLPPDKLSQNRRFTRLVLSSAMRAHFRPGPVSTLFVLDEFRATVGKLPIVLDVWALVREYGMQLMPIVQSLVQLKAMFGDEWETFVGQAGAVATIGPAGDQFSAEWMSKRSGTTTVLQRGYNIGDGVNSGDGANSGTGLSISSGGATSNQGASRNYGSNKSGTYTVQQVERPAISPQEMMNLKPGHGRIWPHGMGGRSIPFFAVNYWNREADWAKRVKRNPYYNG
jgi:type IV secretion system protein VirD4